MATISIVRGLGRGILEAVQRPSFQRRAERTLKRGHHGRVVVGDEGEGHPGSGGTASAADAMHISVDRLRHIIVNDVRNVPHIETACGEVGRDQDLKRAAPEALEGRLTLGLRQVALQRRGAVSCLGQMVRHALRLMLCARKYQA